MTIRLGVLPYGPSDSCRDLRNALVEAFSNTREVTPRLIKTQNSEFRGNSNDIIVNYGNRSAPTQVYGQATVLNPQSALNNAANKVTALQVMQRAGVSTVPWTTRIGEAQQWVEAGETVYARATLTGHSGEGITVHRNRDEILPQVSLYTKAITGQRREWRVHIFKGVITYVQVKRRANGYQNNPLYQEEIRNHHTGWIYATENINPSAAVLRNAVRAVAALGLDFGAVDIISRRDDAWVLEVNTAPGLSGTTLEVFTRNVVEFVEARRTGRLASYLARFPAPTEPTAAPSASQQTEQAESVRHAERGGELDAMVVSQSATVGEAPMQVQAARRGESRYADGYYIGTVQNQDGGQSFRSILWVSNGRFYRHGWNHPVESGRVSGVSAIGSVILAGGETLNLNFATQE